MRAVISRFWKKKGVSPNPIAIAAKMFRTFPHCCPSIKAGVKAPTGGRLGLSVTASLASGRVEDPFNTLVGVDPGHHGSSNCDQSSLSNRV